MNHLRLCHDTDPCPYDHCSTRKTIPLNPSDSTAKHIGKSHGEYECGLITCKTSVSQFSEIELMEHLQLDHGMEWELVLKVRDTAKRNRDWSVQADHITGIKEILDCTLCIQRNSFDGRC